MNILKNLKFTPYTILSLASVVLSALYILITDAPPGSRVAMVLALILWAGFMFRIKAFVPILAALMALIAYNGVGMGLGLPSVLEQPHVLWAVVCGMAGLGLRLIRGDVFSAIVSGLLWASMTLWVPGLAPLGVLGLLSLGMLQPEHGRKAFFPGLLLMISALLHAVLTDALPPDLFRYTEAATYSELGQSFLALFENPSFLIAFPLVGVFELVNRNPVILKHGHLHLPIFGSLLCFLFLPSETALGLLYFVALPASAIMLTRWVLALPFLRERVDSPLCPPSHPMPDNPWHTALTVILAATLAWLAWTNGLETFRAQDPVTPTEAALFAGEPAHPLYATLENWVEPSKFAAGTWNRFFSTAGFLLALGMMVRLLSRQVGVQLALAAMILLVSIPGFASQLCSAGSGSMAIWLILMGLSAVLLNEDQASWLRGGVLMGLGVWLYPLWFLPVLGVLIGIFEVFRARLHRFGLGLGGGLTLGLVLMFLWDTSWTGSLFASAFSRTAPAEGLALESTVLFASFIFLSALLLLFFFGATRRGVGWWALLFSLPAALSAHMMFEEPARALAPFLVLGCMGFVRLPALMDIRHPSMYQTVLTTQLILWLPLHLHQYLLGL